MCCGKLQQFQRDRQYDAPFSARSNIYRQKWERFVRQGRAHWTHATSTSVICGAHFVTPDDFDGYQQWGMGYKRQLDLKKGAIPTKMSICESKSTSPSEVPNYFAAPSPLSVTSRAGWGRPVAAYSTGDVT